MNTTADEYAVLVEQYVSGTLAPEMQDAFEEHYFTCDNCLKQVQLIQSLHKNLQAQPRAVLPKATWYSQLWRPFPWRAGLALAAVLLLAFGIFWRFSPRSETSSQVASQPVNSEPVVAPAPAPRPADPAPQPQVVASLELPPYTPARLRGSFTADPHFEKGMSDYQAGECAAAAAELKQVASASSQWDGAQFYRGACLLKLEDAKGAAAALETVARPDSAYDEPARYYLALAQHALGNDAAAKKLLRQLAANKWDYAARAAAELQKLK